MPSVDQIAKQYIDNARRNPAQRYDILRGAAQTFMGAAQDSRNARVRDKLSSIGLKFAQAASNVRPPVVEDFADLLHETADAYEEVGPFGDDVQDLIARRREIHQDRTYRSPGQVFITPESFTNDATLGRLQKIKWAPTEDERLQEIQQSQTVAFWQGKKTEAQAMTVDVGLNFLPTIDSIPDVPLPLSARPYGEVEFGSDGFRTKAKFDIGQGKRFTVVGNYIAVNVGMGPPREGDESPVLTVGASIGAFAAPSPAPLTLTEYMDLLVPGTDRTVAIPQKAVRVLPIQTGFFVGQAINITFYDYGLNIVTRFFYVQAINYAMSPIPIPGDAAFINVQLPLAVGTTQNVRLMYELAL